MTAIGVLYDYGSKQSDGGRAHHVLTPNAVLNAFHNLVGAMPRASPTLHRKASLQGIRQGFTM